MHTEAIRATRCHVCVASAESVTSVTSGVPSKMWSASFVVLTMVVRHVVVRLSYRETVVTETCQPIDPTDSQQLIAIVDRFNLKA